MGWKIAQGHSKTGAVTKRQIAVAHINGKTHAEAAEASLDDDAVRSATRGHSSRIAPV